MDLISQVTLLGGVCDRAALIRLRARYEVDAALRRGTLERDARGRYSLASTRPAIRTANRLVGVLSHRSAAQLEDGHRTRQIRFSWYLVMYEPAYVHETLLGAVAFAQRHANVA